MTHEEGRPSPTETTPDTLTAPRTIPDRGITRRRRDAANLDAHLGVWRFRRPWPYSGNGTGTELDWEQRSRAGAAA